MAEADACVLCRGATGDAELQRIQVWEDDLWRLSTTVIGEVAGLSYLEPKRHIPHMEDLDGPEAQTFGSALARTSQALKDATGAEQVYLYVFGGGIAHLHVLSDGKTSVVFRRRARRHGGGRSAPDVSEPYPSSGAPSVPGSGVSGCDAAAPRCSSGRTPPGPRRDAVR